MWMNTNNFTKLSKSSWHYQYKHRWPFSAAILPKGKKIICLTWVGHWEQHIIFLYWPKRGTSLSPGDIHSVIQEWIKWFLPQEHENSSSYPNHINVLISSIFLAFCQGLAFYLCVSALMMKRWSVLRTPPARLSPPADSRAFGARYSRFVPRASRSWLISHGPC